MVKFWTRQGWGGVLLAAFLVAGLMAPTMDAFICGADEMLVSASHDKAGQVASKDAPAKPFHDDDGDALCAHGHCHHWVGFASPGERQAVTLALSVRKPSHGLYGPPPSAPQIELLRPPRA